jgi:hypothetical protein
VLHIGDFGIWPTPKKSTGARAITTALEIFPNGLRHHAAPRRTVFIKGNHEDL